ncbi:hypothetical protein EU537_07005 [Candidatus Thorarchaeota archaeon]|nr:MAG: hypothetical protein EU537_07005 [Candidatus Thorarchaeota archaeon]
MPLTIVPVFSSLTALNIKNRRLNDITETGAKIQEVHEHRPLTDRRAPIHIFVGSGGTENAIAEYVLEQQGVSSVVLIAHDSNNSLPAALETKTWLQKKSIDCKLVCDSYEGILKKLEKWNEFSKVLDSIEKMKIGQLGAPSDWLIGSEVNRDLVKQHWGIEIVLEALDDILSEIEPLESERQMEEFMEKAKRTSVSKASIAKAANLAAKMEQAVLSKYDAVTIRCFDIVMESGITGCYAVSLLNDQGITAGCEGDIPSLFSMLLVREIIDQASFMGNVVSINENENTIGLAHCTVPLSLTSEYEISDHYETGKSVSIRGGFKEQEVTVFKVAGESLKKYWVSSGEIVGTPRNEEACRTQVKIRLNKPIDYFMERPLGNHHIMTLGNHEDLLSSFMSFATRGY